MRINCWRTRMTKLLTHMNSGFERTSSYVRCRHIDGTWATCPPPLHCGNQEEDTLHCQKVNPRTNINKALMKRINLVLMITWKIPSQLLTCQLIGIISMNTCWIPVLYSANPEENIRQVVYMYICAMGHGHSFTSRESVTAGGTSRPEQKADG